MATETTGENRETVPARVAASRLRGRGARFRKQEGSAVERLMRERQRDDREAEPR